MPTTTRRLRLGYSTTVVVCLCDSVDQVWDTTGTPGLTTYNSTNVANYQIGTTEIGTNSGIYTVTIPATLPAGLYYLDWITQTWSSDPVHAAFTTCFEWDGSAVVESRTILADTNELQQHHGYAGGPNGFGVYLDSGAANELTVLGVDGTKDNPVSTPAAAKTISDALVGANGKGRIYLINDSNANFNGTYDGMEIIGIGALTANAIDATSGTFNYCKFKNISISNAIGGTERLEFDRCYVGATGVRGTLRNCMLAASLTIANGESTHFHNCYGAGLTLSYFTPIQLTFAGSTAKCAFWGGSVDVTALGMTGSGNEILMHGDHKLTLHSSCVAGAVALRSPIEVTGKAAFVAAGGTFVSFPITDAIGFKGQTITDWDDGERLDLLLDAIPTTFSVKKNTALAAFPFKMVLASDNKTAATGLTVACTRSIDGAAFANCANTPATEVSGGWYKIDLAAADLNGDTIALEFDGGATANVLPVTIVTQP